MIKVWWAPRNTYTGDSVGNEPHGRGHCQNLADNSSYNGGWKHGKRHGEGEMTFTDGETRNGRKRYQGMWTEDNMDGVGEAEWINGYTLQGEFSSNLLKPGLEYTLRIPKTKSSLATTVTMVFGAVPGTQVGQYLWDTDLNPVQLVFKAAWYCTSATPGRFADSDHVMYTGESSAFMPHGKGRMDWPDKSFYEGEWRDGLRHGKGLHRYVDRGGAGGGQYDGEWKVFNCATHMHGRGTARWFDARGAVEREFEGRFVRNCPEQGRLTTFANGVRSEQRVRYDGRTYIWDPALQPTHAQEGLVEVAGGRYEGERSSSSGAPHGQGKMEFADGGSYEGEWREGKMEGRGRLCFGRGSAGAWYEGEMRGGELEGRGELEWRGGAVLDGVFAAGRPLYGHRREEGGRSYVWYDGTRKWDDPELAAANKMELPAEEGAGRNDDSKGGGYKKMCVKVAKVGAEVALEVVSVFPGAGLVLKLAGSVVGKVRGHLARQNEGKRCLLWCRVVQSAVEMTVTLSPCKSLNHNRVQEALAQCNTSLGRLDEALLAALALLPAEAEGGGAQAWHKKALAGPKWLYCKLKRLFGSAQWKAVEKARAGVKAGVENLYLSIHEPEHSALPLGRLRQLLDEKEFVKQLSPAELKHWHASLASPASRILHAEARAFWQQSFGHDDSVASDAMQAALSERTGSSAQVAQAMRHLDKNADGLVTIEEFNEWTIFQGLPF